MKKYELTKDTHKTTFSKKPLYRIKATKDFVLSDGTKISKGDLGGYVSSLKNLSQDGSCWIMPEAAAIDGSQVIQDAILKDNALVMNNAEVRDDAIVKDSALIKGFATIKDNALVVNNAEVRDNAIIKDSALIKGFATIKDNASVAGFAVVKNIAVVKDNAKIIDNVIVRDAAVVCGSALISGSAVVRDKAQVSNNAFVGDRASIEDNAIVSAGNISGFAIIRGNVNISSKDVFIKGKSVVTGNAILNKKTFINTNNTIGVNVFNCNKYSFNVSSDIYTKITDENFLQYSLVPISEKCCMLFRPSGFISLYLPNLSERYPFVPYSTFFTSKKELWEGLMEKIVSKALSTPKGLSSEELLFYEFFLNTNYIDIEEMIIEASDIFFKCLIGSSSPLTAKTIKKNLIYLIKMYQRYLFAYFIGFLLRLFEKIYDLDEYVCSNEPVKELLNCCCIDLVNKTISSLEENLFYNNEIIRMIKNVCGFSEEWETKMISLFSGSFRNAVLLKGLIL